MTNIIPIRVAPTVAPIAAPPITDADCASEIMSFSAGTCPMHVEDRGFWYAWDSQRWEASNTAARKVVHAYAQWKSDALLQNAADEIASNPTLTKKQQEDIRAGARRNAKDLRSAARENAILAKLSTMSSIKAEEMGGDPNYLNTPAGIVDLRTGETHRHDPRARYTRITGVAPARIPTPLFDEFLREITCYDESMALWLQRYVGYCATGLTTEQIVAFFTGGGGNGKSTFVLIMRKALGDFHQTMSPNVVTYKSISDEHPTVLAAVEGARLVTTMEIQKGATWHEQNLKSLSGGDEITARRMRQDIYSFTPTCGLIISANSKPRFRQVDDAIRRRFKLVPLEAVFDKHNRVLDFHLKLEVEAAGILQWIIDGAAGWYARGLPPCTRIDAASETYMEEEDIVGRFVEDRMRAVPGAETSVEDIYGAFKPWMEALGHKPWNQDNMTARLTEMGLTAMQAETGKPRKKRFPGGHPSRYVEGYEVIPWVADWTTK